MNKCGKTKNKGARRILLPVLITVLSLFALFALLVPACSSGIQRAVHKSEAIAPPYMSDTTSGSSASGGGWGAVSNVINDADYFLEMEEQKAMENGEWGESATPQATYGGYDDGYDTTANAAGNSSDSVASSVSPEKIIQTAGIDLQTDQFDEAVDQLRGVAMSLGGYVESANLYGSERNRRFNITLRVPTDRFETARKQVEAMGHLTNAWQNAEDVTAQYYDIASRLETKRIEEERVLDMITRAVKIDDLLSLERRLGEIRTQIERYESRMTTIDRLAAYSTIHVSLAEVTKEELIIVSDNLGGRMQRAFVRSVNNTSIFFQEIIIFLAGALIPLTAVGLVVFVGIKTAFAVHDKNKNKKR